MRARRLLPAATLALALLAGPAASADVLVTGLSYPSKIRDYAGIQVLSVSADRGHVFHLAIRRAGKLELLPVATSKAQFDVDIGPDAKGRPMLVYARCKVEEPGIVVMPLNDRCDLVSYPLAASGGVIRALPSVERPIRGANTTASEIRPTVWKGRIAFARHVKGQPVDAIYTRALDAPRGTPSRRLPGIPRGLPGGQRSTRGSVDELELSGAKLAEIVTYDAARPDVPGEVFPYTEARVVDLVSRTSARVVRAADFGEGGRILSAVAIADGYLGVALSCVVACDPLRPGIYRYRLASHTLERADFSPLVQWYVVGLALASADSAYTTESMVTNDGYCVDAEGEETPCGVVFDDGMRFERVG